MGGTPQGPREGVVRVGEGQAATKGSAAERSTKERKGVLELQTNVGCPRVKKRRMGTEHDRAVRAQARALERMDDQALLDAVEGTTVEEYERMHDAVAMLEHGMGDPSYRDRCLDLERESALGRRPTVVERREDLGWDVLRHISGPTLRSFPGPKRIRKASDLEWMAQSVVHDRLAKQAMEWLEGYEAGGAARERAERIREEKGEGRRGRAGAPEGTNR